MQRSSFPKWTLPGSLVAASLVAVCMLTVRCDPTVDILQASDQYQYSLFGALNVAADTQVVRVDPIGDSTQIGAPKDINGTVRLENVDTGGDVVMRDSFMTVGGTEKRVHNFWTTHSIEPETSYKIVVQRDGSPITTATTITPARAPTLTHDSTFYVPCSSAANPDVERAMNTFIVEAHNTERVAAADVIYDLEFDDGEDQIRRRRIFSHYDAIVNRGSSVVIPVYYKDELTELNPDAPVGFERTCAGKEHFAHPYVRVAVSAGGPNWPDWRGIPLDEIARPNSFSNVEGGHGFVAGIYSDTIKVPMLDRPDDGG